MEGERMLGRLQNESVVQKTLDKRCGWATHHCPQPTHAITHSNINACNSGPRTPRPHLCSELSV